MGTRRKRYPPPPAPADPQNWQLIEPKDGKSYWRRKRGTIKKAEINEAFKKNVAITKLASPAASAIRNKLLPFLDFMDTARFIAKVSGRLRKIYKEKGKLDLQVMKDYEIQPYRPLSDLIRAAYQARELNGEVVVDIKFNQGPQDRRNSVITDFYFEAILLSGDPGNPKSLRVDSEKSDLYDIHMRKQTTCRLSLMLPGKKKSWIVLMKVGCNHGKVPAINPRHYAMRVILTGSTK